MLELFPQLASPEWWAALAVIIAVDLLLAGDNAVVIALAARDLPPHLQKRAIIAGTIGAVVARVALVFVAFELLEVTGLRVVGGLLLFYIAWRLAAQDENGGGQQEQKPAARNFWQAMRTIIIADVVMGLDNILAIAGAAGDDFSLVIIGFALSVPIMIFCSVIILRIMTKAPWLVVAGAALLAGIGARMILEDNLLEGYVAEVWQLPVILIAVVIFTAAVVFWNRRRV